MQPAGFRAFIPKPLPPEPPLGYDEQMQSLLSLADRALARLDAIGLVLPNPELFIAMYVKKEALLSSQIEGTQASLNGVLEFEANLPVTENSLEVGEAINYIKALNCGMKRLEEFPMSLRLIGEIHGVLIQGTRGGNRTPGEFRRSQNWIGPPGFSLNHATFIPPPPDQVLPAMGELEKFLHAQNKTPDLVKIALVHAQFETIHPFLDGNGRIGRLLITFYLFWKGLLSRPLLYLSSYLKKNREEYYDRLGRIRSEGDWEGWVKFFLSGVAETADQAVATARVIVELKQSVTARVYQSFSSIHAVRLVDLLFESPMIDVKTVAARFGISKAAAHQLIGRFENLGVLKEQTGKQRYKLYLFQEYVDLFAEGTRSVTP
jgi:Fic family protein